jgi:hypothetical protein
MRESRLSQDKPNSSSKLFIAGIIIRTAARIVNGIGRNVVAAELHFTGNISIGIKLRFRG